MSGGKGRRRKRRELIFCSFLSFRENDEEMGLAKEDERVGV